jgi:cob(I)alamin adenosyltransferase
MENKSLTLVYTGDGKGKTSASLGQLVRGLGAGWKVAFVQFIKVWEVSEHAAIIKLQEVYPGKLEFYKGGKGFYNAGTLSAKGVEEDEHKAAALATYEKAREYAESGDYDLVICDEINNAVNDGLLTRAHLRHLITKRAPGTNLVLTGRNWPTELSKYADTITEMTKHKHPYDSSILACKGIDY